MKRREFVALLGGAAAWPIAARAQQSGAMRRIAVVGALAPDDVEIVKRRAAFEQALAALGWTKGGTIAIDYHWIANDPALAKKTAVEVVALAPDVLLASSNIVIEQLSKATDTTRRAAIIAAANKNHLPSIFPYRYYAADGGLASYGPDTVDQYRRAASYIDRILKGEKAANLPVQGPTRYELTINLKTAKTLGLTVPQSILLRADEVIE